MFTNNYTQSEHIKELFLIWFDSGIVVMFDKREFYNC